MKWINSETHPKAKKWTTKEQPTQIQPYPPSRGRVSQSEMEEDPSSNSSTSLAGKAEEEVSMKLKTTRMEKTCRRLSYLKDLRRLRLVTTQAHEIFVEEQPHSRALRIDERQLCMKAPCHSFRSELQLALEISIISADAQSTESTVVTEAGVMEWKS